MLAKPAKPAAPSRRSTGTVYVLGKEFLVNLADGRYAKFTAALVLDARRERRAAGGRGRAKPPEGFGAMAQEAVVREVISDAVSDVSARDVDLIEPQARERKKRSSSRSQEGDRREGRRHRVHRLRGAVRSP